MSYLTWLLGTIDSMRFQRRRTSERRHNAQQTATGYKREYMPAYLASGKAAAAGRAYGARKKAYFEELFTDAPEKRVYVGGPR